MSTRINRCALPLVVALFLTFFVTVAAPAHALADKNCDDFSSQKAAQLFYLKAGGPQQDPHGLDADDDGVACDSNPCPCYYGTKPPGNNPPATPPKPVKSSVTLSASSTSGITGEKVRMVARVKPHFSRSIVLQRKAGNRWVRETAGKTKNDGKWVLNGSVARKTTIYRVAVPAVKRSGKKYTAATSKRITIKALEQRVSLQLSDRSVIEGERVVATVTAQPARAGRPVILQRRSNNGWTRVGTDEQSRAGKARIVFDANSQGTFEYRAVVKRHRGAVSFRSTTRELDVAPPPDTTAPEAPQGLTAVPSDGAVDLDWSDVAAPDLAGYRVYVATAADGPWTMVADALTASAYRASGLTNGTQYFFTVTAVDSSGNESARSAVVSGTPTAPVPAPAG